MPKPSQSLPSRPASPDLDLQARLESLPAFFDHRDILRCFDDDPDRFTRAYIRGELPPIVREVVDRSLPADVMIRWLLVDIASRLERLEGLATR